MPDGRFAILDPVSGISGDMLLGALIAAGASPEWLRGLPARLGFPDVTVDMSMVDRCGVRATKVDVRLPDGTREEPSESVQEHSHEHDHDQAHPHDHGRHDHGSGPHRHIGELIDTVERANVSPWVRERAVRAFRLLGEAEGRVHGLPAEQVALHEVGAMDALVDIVGGIEGFEQLGITRVYTRPVAVGSGWVRAAHGVMPVPAPATAILLEGVEVGPNGPVIGEATTPTGAVLLRVLSAGPPPARWRASTAGAWGAGGRNPTDYPNALRLILADAAARGRRSGPAVHRSGRSESRVSGPAAGGALSGRRARRAAVGDPDEERAERLPGGDHGGSGRGRPGVEALFRHSTTAGIRRYSASESRSPAARSR